MKCPTCGFHAREAGFCPICGEKLEPPEENASFGETQTVNAEQQPAQQNPYGAYPQQPAQQNPYGAYPQQPVQQNPYGAYPRQPAQPNASEQYDIPANPYDAYGQLNASQPAVETASSGKNNRTAVAVLVSVLAAVILAGVIIMIISAAAYSKNLFHFFKSMDIDSNSRYEPLYDDDIEYDRLGEDSDPALSGIVRVTYDIDFELLNTLR